MIFENWLINIDSIWQRVLGIAGYFNEVEQKIMQEKRDNYTLTVIIMAI